MELIPAIKEEIEICRTEIKARLDNLQTALQTAIRAYARERSLTDLQMRAEELRVSLDEIITWTSEGCAVERVADYIKRYQ
jgi:hypothetical protein